jgi:O-antigen ligase
VLPAVLAVLIGFFAISGDVVGKRLVRTFGATDLRFSIYDVTLDGISERPYLGMGAGTFEQVFAFIRPETFSHRGVIVRAHSTYLENALELGIPAAAALVLAVVLLALVCLRGVRRRRNDAYYPALGFAASVLVGLHSLVDFSLQIPAVSVTYAFVLGLACAQSWGSREPL